VWLIYTVKITKRFSILPWSLLYSCLFMFKSAVARYNLARGPGQLKSSNLALVLQYGSGPSPNFLAKILGVITSLFLCKTPFYFSLSSLLIPKPHKSRHTDFFCNSSVDSLPTVQVVSVWFLMRLFLTATSIMTLEAVIFYLTFCIYFISSFIHIWKQWMQFFLYHPQLLPFVQIH
jgi:hypothetical protein